MCLKRPFINHILSHLSFFTVVLTIKMLTFECDFYVNATHKLYQKKGNHIYKIITCLENFI